MKRPARPLLALAVLLWLGALARDRLDAWVDATALPPLDIATSVEVRDRDGALLRAYTVADGRWRLAVTSADVDPGFVRLLLACEDRNFRSHPGVDPLALLRAAGQAVLAGHVVSGGSTLTMQVARLLEDSGTGHVEGKLRQIRVALALERRLTKDQILNLYLLLAPYGGNVEGIRAATLAYFGKEPRRLTPAEAALLVAIPQSPETRRPDRFVARATDARDRVLARAVGAGVYDAATADAARREVVPAARRDFPSTAPHLADRARAAFPTLPVIDLTIAKPLQQALEALAAQVVRGEGERLQVAIVVADHRSGEILASVGSAAFQADARQGFIDMTDAIRSPGSTLKPLVYGLAFDEGLAHPETLIDDVPSDFSGYRPQNFDRQFRGTIRLREALQLSLNIPAVALTEALGPAKLLQAMDKAGMDARLPPGQPGLAIALGGIGVTLTDMVQLYAAIARGGVALPLTWVKGQDHPPGARILSDVAAWEVGDILAGLEPPPGAPQNRLAYKTGTSYGHRDAWAIGFDGAHAVGVWMGRPDGSPVPGAFGADLAAPVLFQAFARIAPALTPLPPAPAATLLVATAQLPQPLQHFRPRTAAFATAPDAPTFSFPPDGAEVELLPQGLMVRVAGGTAPFTWLADGAPVATGLTDRQTMLTDLHPGFVTLSVIDARGRSARAQIRLR
jgi:penicillin-binding protein 1C